MGTKHGFSIRTSNKGSNQQSDPYIRSLAALHPYLYDDNHQTLDRRLKDLRTDIDPATHTRLTREAYDRLAPVWSATTDDGPWNGHLERPAFRSLIPVDISGATVLDAGCGAGAQADWLLERGAEVIGVDLSPAMVEESTRRCGSRGRFFVWDLTEPLPLEANSVDGITCSLTLHYLNDWTVPLRSFADTLRPGGWVVLSLPHPFGYPAGKPGGYFDTKLVSDNWTHADVTVTQHFWLRPMAPTISAFTDASFVVDRVAEPQPSAEALQRFPQLGQVVGVPWFIVFRLRRTGSH